MPDIETVKARVYYDRFYSTGGVWPFLVAVSIIVLIGFIIAWV